jgi:hypothetical protein
MNLPASDRITEIDEQLFICEKRKILSLALSHRGSSELSMERNYSYKYSEGPAPRDANMVSFT